MQEIYSTDADSCEMHSSWIKSLLASLCVLQQFRIHSCWFNHGLDFNGILSITRKDNTKETNRGWGLRMGKQPLHFTLCETTFLWVRVSELSVFPGWNVFPCTPFPLWTSCTAPQTQWLFSAGSNFYTWSPFKHISHFSSFSWQNTSCHISGCSPARHPGLVEEPVKYGV